MKLRTVYVVALIFTGIVIIPITNDRLFTIRDGIQLERKATSANKARHYIVTPGVIDANAVSKGTLIQANQAAKKGRNFGDDEALHLESSRDSPSQESSEASIVDVEDGNEHLDMEGQKMPDGEDEGNLELQNQEQRIDIRGNAGSLDLASALGVQPGKVQRVSLLEEDKEVVKDEDKVELEGDGEDSSIFEEEPIDDDPNEVTARRDAEEESRLQDLAAAKLDKDVAAREEELEARREEAEQEEKQESGGDEEQEVEENAKSEVNGQLGDNSGNDMAGVEIEEGVESVVQREGQELVKGDAKVEVKGNEVETRARGMVQAEEKEQVDDPEMLKSEESEGGLRGEKVDLGNDKEKVEEDTEQSEKQGAAANGGQQDVEDGNHDPGFESTEITGGHEQELAVKGEGDGGVGEASEEEAVWFEPLGRGAPLKWPSHLVLSMAIGYEAADLRILIESFRRHVHHATLVLFVDKKPQGWTPQPRVVLQFFHPPEEGALARLKPWTLRHVLYDMFLKVIRHDGHVLMTDARDVAFLGDPFAVMNDDRIHFFQEKARLPLPKQKLTANHRWLDVCFGERNAYTLGDKRVINAGLVMGPARQVVAWLGLMRLEYSRQRIKCLDQPGSDQAILIFTVYTGRAKEAFKFQLDESDHGPILQAFSKKVKYIIHANRTVSTVNTSMPFVAVHGYNKLPDLQELIKSEYGMVTR